MAACKDCGEGVMWLRREDGSWMPPYEPTTEFATGDYVLASADGIMQVMPQVFKRHDCPVARGIPLDERRKRLVQERESREEERRRLLREADERRREQERFDAELAEAKRIKEQRAIAKTRDEQAREREFATAVRMMSERLLSVPCRECGAEVKEPCRSTGNSHPRWYRGSPHDLRRRDAPAVPLPRRWGEDYEGPWPPESGTGGYREMQNWLNQNFQIFDQDGYSDRDWLMPKEADQMTTWLRRNARILTEEHS